MVIFAAYGGSSYSAAVSSRGRTRFVSVLVALLISPLVFAGSNQAALTLKSLTLEELLAVEITSVTRREQYAFQTAAAITVISTEDIKRSGATSIAEALRLAPGIQVSQVDSSTWAISARGDNRQFADKLLVLVDGRTVFTGLFGGVFYDVQDYVLEDIERIEVIRGPGGTVWGANAVNGVINIITKHAKETQGLLVTTAAGNVEKMHAQLRYGGRLGDAAQYRVYLKGFQRSEYEEVSGGKSVDDWQQFRGGFRLDWTISSEDELTISSDVYRGTSGARWGTMPDAPGSLRTYDEPVDLSGENIQARWVHEFKQAGSTAIQIYWDHRERDIEVIDVPEKIFDFNFQYNAAEYHRNTITLGAGYRNSSLRSRNNNFSISFEPDSRKINLLNAFIQDEITVLRDVFNLTLGLKIEHYDEVGMQFMPNIRGAWMQSDRSTVWVAYSRAVGSLSFADLGVDAHLQQLTSPPFPVNTTLRAQAQSDVKPWSVDAYEIGWRILPTPGLSFDLTAYYNRYRRFTEIFQTGNIVCDPITCDATSHMDLSALLGNASKGPVWGAELEASLQVTDRWRLKLIYSYLDMNLSLFGGRDSPRNDESAPHIVSLMSRFDLSSKLNMDWNLYWNSAVPGSDIDSYIRLDVRAAWAPVDWLELAIVAQNLNDKNHKEATGFIDTGTLIPRSIYLKAVIAF